MSPNPIMYTDGRMNHFYCHKCLCSDSRWKDTLSEHRVICSRSGIQFISEWFSCHKHGWKLHFLCVFFYMHLSEESVLCLVFLYLGVPVLLVMFGDLFVEVLRRVEHEAELWEISRCVLRFTVVPQLSYKTRERSIWCPSIIKDMITLIVRTYASHSSIYKTYCDCFHEYIFLYENICYSGVI